MDVHDRSIGIDKAGLEDGEGEIVSKGSWLCERKQIVTKKI